jgi:hypothetical protein
MKTYKMILILCAVILASCKKDYLNEKPSSSLITPAGLTDYQNLLDNSKIMNTTGALPQLSSDEYFITDKASFDALGTQTQKNAYLWNSDISVVKRGYWIGTSFIRLSFTPTAYWMALKTFPFRRAIKPYGTM